MAGLIIRLKPRPDAGYQAKTLEGNKKDDTGSFILLEEDNHDLAKRRGAFRQKQGECYGKEEGDDLVKEKRISSNQNRAGLILSSTEVGVTKKRRKGGQEEGADGSETELTGYRAGR